MLTISFPAARRYDLPESVWRLLALYCGPLLPDAGGWLHADVTRGVWEREFLPALRAAGVDLRTGLRSEMLSAKISGLKTKNPR